MYEKRGLSLSTRRRRSNVREARPPYAKCGQLRFPTGTSGVCPKSAPTARSTPDDAVCYSSADRMTLLTSMRHCLSDVPSWLRFRVGEV